MSLIRIPLIAALAASFLTLSSAIAAPLPAAVAPMGDIPATFTAPTVADDYIKRDVMIPMRDGVRLHTVIVIPKGAKDAPILLTRTPYDASHRAARTASHQMLSILPQGDEVFVQAGYIRVFQDIRGKYGSEGPYFMTLPPRGPLNAMSVDETTDAFDTIDWLVKNIPESNGRVGMIGSSYEGFTVAMALLDPHPALKVAAPESPMIDGWMGDDWFHYGAFRQINIDYFGEQTQAKGDGESPIHGGADDYETFLTAGSIGDFAAAAGYGQLPYWGKMSSHPAYDAFWQGQALDKLMATHPSNVPTMWIQGLWDQEDMWGANHAYAALKAAGHGANNYLVMGPWRHSGVNYDGSSLGPLAFDGDTALQFRRDVLLPFFNQYLKPGAPTADTPRVFIYNTGENHWDRLKSWPLACEQGCAAPMKPLYLLAGLGLGFEPPAAGGSAFDAYVSDPAKPVPFVPRPMRMDDGKMWKPWLVSDQRSVDGRTDVLTYETPPLTTPVRISGAPIADLYAATSGTDSDWVVKLIDVYPQEVASRPEMGGYELPIAMDIFRGRYRERFAAPSPIPAGKTERYRFALPNANHVFLPGHRIMVQIQSSWFPLYDRNPQTYVPNIFFATPADYQPATQQVFHAPGAASAVWLPIVP